MEYNAQAEKLFYLHTLEAPKFYDKIDKNYFKNEELKNLFHLAKEFFKKFKESPSAEQMKTVVAGTRYKEVISANIINEVYSTDLREYDSEWLDDSLKSWVKFKSLESSMIQSIEYIKSNKIDSDNIDSIVEKVRSIVQEKNNVNFDNSFGVNFMNAEDHKIDARRRIPSGKQFFDQLSGGGIDPKTITVYAGEQNIGKCLIHTMKIKVRNKITGNEEEIFIGDFFEKIKKS